MKLYRAAERSQGNTAAEFRGPSYLLVSISLLSVNGGGGLAGDERSAQVMPRQHSARASDPPTPTASPASS